MPAIPVILSRRCFFGNVVLGQRVGALCDFRGFHETIRDDFGEKVIVAPPHYPYQSGNPIEFSAVSCESVDGKEPRPEDIFAAIDDDRERPACFIELVWAILALECLCRNGHVPFPRITALGTLFDSAIRGERKNRFACMANEDYSRPRVSLVSRANIGLPGLTFITLPKHLPMPLNQAVLDRSEPRMVAVA